MHPLEQTSVEKLTRRAAARRIAWLAAGSGLASAATFERPVIHHVSLQVADIARSSEFYSRMFGIVPGPIRKDGSLVLPLEQGQIVIRKADPAGLVDHIGIGLDHFDRDAVSLALKASQGEPIEDKAIGFYVKDPDGVPVQLLKNIEPGDHGAFPGARLDHVSICYGDAKRSVEFYRRVLGFPMLDQRGTTVRIAVGKGHFSLRNGGAPGKIDHFAIGIDNFKEENVTRDLKARGAMVINGGPEGLHIFDPDGYPVQVASNMR